MDLKDAHWGMRVVWTVRIRERALRLKSNTRRGGFAENVFMRKVELGLSRVAQVVLTIDFMYRDSFIFKSSSVSSVVASRVSPSPQPTVSGRAGSS
jgi:polygalacturonase